MYKRYIIILFCIFYINNILLAQNSNDSLVKINEVTFSSDFEKENFMGFLDGDERAAFNLFLAIDNKIDIKDAEIYYNVFQNNVTKINTEKFNKKKINKKIQLAYTKTHASFLKKYSDVKYFPEIFITGNYNCVSASMIYALVFNELDIQYKVMASPSHVYLVANPGPKSIVIETTNPNFASNIFSGEYKQAYANYLKQSKLISEDEYKNKSTEEIFEENFNKVEESTFLNLPGFQYYNMAVEAINKMEYKEGLINAQKAYLFYPSQQTESLLYNCLLINIDEADFETIQDAQLLVQLSRFKNIDEELIVGLFNNAITSNMEYSNRLTLCHNIHDIMVQSLPGTKLADEISFNFNLIMSYNFQGKPKIEPYLLNAIGIKDNHRDIEIMFKNHFQRKFERIIDPQMLLDTLDYYNSNYKFPMVEKFMGIYEGIANLKFAESYFNKKRAKEGLQYLEKFKSKVQLPVTENILRYWIERTYVNASIYYANRGYSSRSRSIAKEGLGFIPESERLLRLSTL